MSYYTAIKINKMTDTSTWKRVKKSNVEWNKLYNKIILIYFGGELCMVWRILVPPPGNQTHAPSNGSTDF